MTSPSLTVSSRGAARVSITWLISLIVLLFVALAFGYIGYEEASKSALAEEAALAEKAVADARWQEDGDAVLAISKEVGFYDATTATPRTDPAAVVAGLEDLKATFSDLGDDTVNLAAALPVVKAAFLKRGQELFRRSGSHTEALVELFQEPARAISRNIVVIALGFVPLLFAVLVPYVTVGLFFLAIMALSGTATFFILPGILSLRGKRAFRSWGDAPAADGENEINLMDAITQEEAV